MATLVIRRSNFVPAVAYVAGGLLVALLAMVSDATWLPMLYLLGGAMALMAWRMRKWSDQVARYASFGALLLLVCALNRGLYFVDYLLSGQRFDEWPFYALSPGRAIFKAEVMTVLGTLLTVAAWSRTGGERISPAIILDRSLVKSQALMAAYLISLLAMLVSRVIPTLQSVLGQLLPSMLGIGLVVSFLLPATRVRARNIRLLMVALMSAPFAVLAAGTGMKENMILSLLPLGVTAWLSFRGVVPRLTMLVAGILAVGLITSYVNFYRAEVWYTKQEGVPTEDVVRKFASETQSEGEGNVAREGVTALLGRNNASWHRGWAVSIADERGHYPDLIFSPMLYVFVPRILWPGKPPIRQGWEYSGLVFGEQYVAWSTSSTAAGLYPAFYLGAGWFGVIFGAMLVGALLALMTKAAMKFGGPLAAGLYIFSMFPFILRLDEAWTVGALSGPVISMVYVVLIAHAARVVAGLFKQRRTLP